MYLSHHNFVTKSRENNPLFLEKSNKNRILSALFRQTSFIYTSWNCNIIENSKRKLHKHNVPSTSGGI